MTTSGDLFDEAYFERLDAARRHWWVVGMQRIGASLLGEHREGMDVLDAGCGTGALLGWLGELASPRHPAGVDLSSAALRQCRRLHPRAALAQGSAIALPFADERFDLVLSADVLQHLTTDEEAEALAEAKRVLRPGGRLLVRTNAAYGRGGAPERADWRLYRPDDLRRALGRAGLEVESLSAVNLAPALLSNLAGRLRHPRRSPAPGHEHGHGDDHDGDARWGLGIPAPVHPLANAVLLGLLRTEARWLAKPGRHLPWGHSLYAVARRRS